MKIEHPAKSVQYEVFFLCRLLRISAENTSRNLDLQIDYLSEDPNPAIRRYLTGGVYFSDFREEFLAAGAPLILTSCFKILDSISEWAVRRFLKNDRSSFEQKIRLLEKNIAKSTFEIIPNAKWLDAYILAFYKVLRPIRNVLVHSGNFENVATGLNIFGNSNVKHITLKQISFLAEFVVKIIHVFQKNRNFDEFSLKEIRWLLDNLSSLHMKAPFHQRKPALGKVRIRHKYSDYIAFDVEDFRLKINSSANLKAAYDSDGILLGEDTLFDLEIVLLEPVSTIESCYLIPWTKVNDFSNGISFVNLKNFALQP